MRILVPRRGLERLIDFFFLFLFMDFSSHGAMYVVMGSAEAVVELDVMGRKIFFCFVLCFQGGQDLLPTENKEEKGLG
jgi:hypothetical protein